jgi:hypothetical protein
MVYLQMQNRQRFAIFIFVRLTTLAITWPLGVCSEENSFAEAAQVNGGVREWQE